MWYIITLITCCKRQINRFWMGTVRLIYAPSQPVRPGQGTGVWNSNYYCSQPIPLGAGRMHSRAGWYWLRSWWGVKACPLQPTQQELLPWFITVRPASFIPLLFVMPDRVAALSISAPRGQAIRCRVPKRQAALKLPSLLFPVWTEYYFMSLIIIHEMQFSHRIRRKYEKCDWISYEQWWLGNLGATVPLTYHNVSLTC